MAEDDSASAKVAATLVKHANVLLREGGSSEWAAMGLSGNMKVLVLSGAATENHTRHAVLLLANEIAYARIEHEASAAALKIAKLTVEDFAAMCFIAGQVAGYDIQQQVRTALAYSGNLEARIIVRNQTCLTGGYHWTILKLAVVPHEMRMAAASAPTADGLQGLLERTISEWLGQS